LNATKTRMNSLKLSISKLRYRTYYIMAVVFLIIFTFLVVAPLVQIIITSLTFQRNDLRMVRGAEVGAFTFYHYSRVFIGRLARALFYRPFVNSLLVGVGVTILSMTIGSLLAWVLVRTDIPFKKFLNSAGVPKVPILLEKVSHSHPLYDALMGYGSGLAADF